MQVWIFSTGIGDYAAVRTNLFIDASVKTEESSSHSDRKHIVQGDWTTVTGCHLMEC